MRFTVEVLFAKMIDIKMIRILFVTLADVDVSVRHLEPL